MRLLLIGNYGTGNLGDEALREYFLKTFPEIEWQVVTADGRSPDVPRLPGGIRSFFGLRWIRTLKALRSCDGVVFGGGSLFTDVESVYACFLWWLHVKAAHLFGKPVFLAFQGIGPFSARRGERLARSAARSAAFISVRDEESFRRVSTWGLKALSSFDPVFSLIGKGQRPTPSQKIFVVIPRADDSPAFVNRIRALVSANAFDVVHILTLQPDNPREQQAIRMLALPQATVIPIRTLADLEREISQASVVLSRRYHGALAALALGIPFEVVSQAHGDKLESLMTLDRAMCGEKVNEGERMLREAMLSSRHAH